MLTDEENLTDMVWANADRFGDAISFRRRVDGSWVDLTTVDFATQVRDVAKGLIAAGLHPGDRVALLSAARYESALLDFAVWAAGGVAVHVDAAATEQIEWILSDSAARAVVVDDAAHHQTVRGVVDRLAEVVRVWRLDGPAPAIDELTALGADIPEPVAHRRRLDVRAEDTAALVYTSGSGGAPKGSELTHRALLDEVRATISRYPRLWRAGNSMLMYLPGAHDFARITTLCCVYSRTTLGHIPDLDELFTDLGTFRPTAIVAVPRVFEHVHTSAKAKAHVEGRGRMFDAAEEIAIAYAAAHDGGGAPDRGLRLKHAVADKLVYLKLRAAFGGRCVAAVCDSEPDPRLAQFFHGIGVPILATS
jgi:long-chain acyl-CoA synthetase